MEDVDTAPVVVLTGTTASGKNRTGAIVAAALHGEVISLDSMKVYVGMDIGTAKPSLVERRGVPHHLLDILSPKESMDLRTYVNRAQTIRRELVAKDRTPVVVGGTQLYLHGFLQGVFEGPDANAVFRDAFRQEVETIGLTALHARLAAVDPATAARLHPNDQKRIERALEVHHLTGRPISELQREGTVRSTFPRYTAVLTWRRDQLDDRIDARVREMFNLGWVDEVRRILLQGGFGRTSSAALGYEEVAAVVNGLLTQAAATEIISANTRKFARKQLTWLRKIPHDLWIEAANDTDVLEAPVRILDGIAAKFPSLTQNRV